MNEIEFTRSSQPLCAVCGADHDKFQDFKGPKRKCGVCGALERQRAFAALLRSDSWTLNLQGARALLISPSVSERKLFSGLPGVRFSTLDVRAEVKPDIVADLCNMPSVPDNSFDVIYACDVLSHAHDLPAALSELSRVLSDGGVLINYEPISKGVNTKELEEIEEISSHYGIEAFKKYKLGRFRKFGEADIENIFSPFFERQAFDAVDDVTGLNMVWNVWDKLAKKPRVAPTKVFNYVQRNCPVCLDSLEEFYSDGNCKKCGSRARLRSLRPFIDEYIKKEILTASLPNKPLLAFAMTKAEKKILDDAFKDFKSVSLFGNYVGDYEVGVDLRDLSRYESNAFSGVFGCLVFDYFIEHELALNECFRVTAPGGLFFTCIAPYRLVDGDVRPNVKGKIKGRPGYFEYLPDNVELLDVKVGRDWFVGAMRRVGFQPAIVRVEDAVPGVVSEWFVGIKPDSTGYSKNATPSEWKKNVELKSRISEVFHSIVPYGESGRASLKIELIEGVPSSLAFLEDVGTFAVLKADSIREIAATNGFRNRIYVSLDLGRTWVEKYGSIKWDDKIRAAFSLKNGGRLIRTFSGRMYHLDDRGALIGSHATGIWHWHGSQGIGESATGTVMYGEYAPLQMEHGVQELSVWRYRLSQSELGWERVLTLPAAARPPEGQLRHFHVCCPNPCNPQQWILASGDIGVHNRLWISNDDGDNWSEITLMEADTSSLPKVGLPQVLRFTQVSVLDNGDLIWATDDTTGSGRSALIQLSLATERPTFYFLGWLGRNCVRNISSCGNDLFLMISESKHDVEVAHCILYDASRGRSVPLSLPNVAQKKNSVTDSLGSAALVDGVGFYPASGAVLMAPEKRGIFRISIKEIDQ